jgi:hypothetical protein
MSRRILSFDVGIRHLALADITKTAEATYKLNRWDILPLIPDDMKVKETNMDNMTEALYTTLDEWYPHGSEDLPETVYVENQPALKNPIMKSIQMIVYGYFTGRRIWMVEGGLAVRFVSASQKVKWAQSKGYCQIDPTIKNRYTATKRASIVATEVVLRSFFEEKDIAIFQASKKKDDLADCLLQGLYVLGA